MLCSWAHIRGESWSDRLSRWFEASGCDGWILQADTQPATRYAAVWIRQSQPDPAELAGLFREWKTYYDQRGIEAVSTGIVICRRPEIPRPPWFRIDRVGAAVAEATGEEVSTGLVLRDYLETIPDERLLEERLAVSPRCRRVLEQKPTPSGGWLGMRRLLRLRRGLTLPVEVDEPTWSLLEQCAQKARPLEELLTGRPGHVVPRVRELIAAGFLLPLSEFKVEP